MNKVVLIGRVVRDPDLKYIQGNGTAVTTVTLAVDKWNKQENKKEADFINIVIWGKQAENTANYMSKGSQMAISGRIQTRSYDDKEGKKRYITEVVAQEVSFLSKGKDNNSSTQNFGEPSFDEDIMPVDDGDIPF